MEATSSPWAPVSIIKADNGTKMPSQAWGLSDVPFSLISPLPLFAASYLWLSFLLPLLCFKDSREYMEPVLVIQDALPAWMSIGEQPAFHLQAPP